MSKWPHFISAYFIGVYIFFALSVVQVLNYEPKIWNKVFLVFWIDIIKNNVGCNLEKITFDWLHKKSCDVKFVLFKVPFGKDDIFLFYRMEVLF